DGHWAPWVQWSECDVTCENGTRSRVRSCDNPAPAQGGDECIGPKHEQDFCVLQTCLDGWDSWSNWSSCSVTCGQGLKHRHRTCNDTMGTMLGGGCLGNDQEQMECKMKSCDMVVVFFAHVPRFLTIYNQIKIEYQVVTVNKGGGYNSSNGVFTAPREGLYLFTSQTCIDNGLQAYTGIVKNVGKQRVVLQSS
ncbi:CADN-like protein, partial [Mya arenaria]